MASKKNKFDSESKADVGMVMTVSLFLILLTFFILLNSIAVIDENRARISIGSLLGAFGSLPGGLSPMKTGESVLPPSAPIVREETGVAELLAMLQEPMKGELKVQGGRDRTIITMSAKLIFQKDRLVVKSSSYPLLDKICHMISQGTYDVDIVGHTDNLPAEDEGYDSNWDLSSRMALQVLKYMNDRGGISVSRLTASGRSSLDPVASNDTIKTRALNKRVEIVLNYRAPPFVKRIFKKKPSGIFTYQKFDFGIF